MANRTISTRLAIEGEAEYRRAITGINNELKTHKSQLALIESEYKGNANSMQALTSKGKALTDMQASQAAKLKELKSALDNASKAQQSHATAVEQYRAKLATAEKALAALKNSTGDTADEQQKLNKEITELQGGLAREEAAVKSTSGSVQGWQRQVNYAQIELNTLNNELVENDKYLDEAKRSTDGCATSIDKYGKETKEAADQSQKFGEKSKVAVSDLRDMLMAAGITATLKQIADAFMACVDASIEFESAITGVYKTVDGTETQLAGITQGVKDLSLVIPATTTEIAAVAEAAGQLGIATPSVMDFTKVMIALGVATNLTSTEGATMLAKFANITKLPTSDYERLGSVIVDLGNNYATTEADIVAFAMRLAGAGSQVGLSQDQIMGISAALSSVGIEAEMGGSAVSKLMINMQASVKTGSEELGKYAQVAGMTADEFTRLFGEDAAAALEAFFSGMALSGDDAVLILQDLGIEEVRLRDTMLRLSNAGGLLNNTLDTASRAWDENTALAEEANKRYATTESKFKMAENAAKNLQVAIGDQLTPALGAMADIGADITTWLADVIDKNPELVAIMVGATSAIGALVLGVTGLMILPKITGFFAAFNAVMVANPVIAVGAAIVGLIATIGILAASADDARVKLDDITEATQAATDNLDTINQTYADSESGAYAAADAADRYIDRMEELEQAGLETAASQQEYADLVALLNETIPGLNLIIDEQTGLIEGGTAALRDNVTAWRENAISQAIIAKQKELYEQYADVAIEAAENRRKLTAAQAAGQDLAKREVTAYKGIADALGITTGELDKFSGAQWEAAALFSDVSALLTEYKGLQSAVADNTVEQDTYRQAIGLSEEAMATYDDQVAETRDLMGEMGLATDTTSQSTTDYAENAKAAYDSVMADLEALETAYNDAYAAAYQSITDQLGLFNELNATTDRTIDDLISALQSQVDYMDEYASNMTAAVALGVDEGLLAKLSDGSEESAGILAAIVAGGKEKVDELNAELQRVEEGKTEFSETMADMETDFDESMTDIEDRAQEAIDEMEKTSEAWQNGAMTVQGYADGMMAKIGEVRQAALAIAKAGMDTMKSTTQQQSPSKKYREIAKLDMAGYIDEMSRSKVNVSAAMRAVASAGLESFSTAKYAAAINRSIPTRVYEGDDDADGKPGGGGNRGPIIVELKLDGELIGKIITPYVSGKQNLDTAQAMRGRG